jgi:hypothetical protein
MRMRRKIDRRTFLKIGGAATGVAIGGGLAAHIASDEDALLMGVWRYLLPIPRPIWQSQVHGDPAQLDFMSEQHHWVRDFAVTELPRVGEPLTPEFIARELDLGRDQVVQLLDDLEQHMTFLFRNDQGAVTWAYPVTVDATPHHLTFSTGERLYAA